MVKTKYFLLLDDDNFFTKQSNIEKLVSILESTDANFAGGDHSVNNIYCGYFGILTFARNQGNGKVTIIHENGVYFEKIQNFEFCYRVNLIKNFFVAGKDEVLKLGGWNDELLVVEHKDFFLRMISHDQKVIFCTDVKIGHNQISDNVRFNRAKIQDKYTKRWMETNNVDYLDYRPAN